jgi:hypothetical protein
MQLDRPRLELAEALGQLDDAYATADHAPESPRRRTLVLLAGMAIVNVEGAGEHWNRGDVLPARSMLGCAVQCCVLLDLLAEVVVRDSSATSPTPAELDLHDRVRAILAPARPALVMAGDTVADERFADDQQPGALRQPLTDTRLDLMLAADAMRERLRARSEDRLPADAEARETAMLTVTLIRHCLDRTVAAIEALSEGDPEAASRDLQAASWALTVCEERLLDEVAALWPPILEGLDNLQQ